MLLFTSYGIWDHVYTPFTWQQPGQMSSKTISCAIQWKQTIVGMQLSEDDIEEVDALYMQNLWGIAELSGGEITTDNFHEVQYIETFWV